MSKPEYVELFLTCGSWQEAQEITDSLLEKQLVSCVEAIEVKSKYWWQARLEEAVEVKLIMKSQAANFVKIETEVKKLHSYETFVLEQVPITNISKSASEWLMSTMNQITDRIKQ